MTKNTPLKKTGTTPPDTKNKTTLWRNVLPDLLKSDAVPTTLKQRYANLTTAKCLQKKIHKIDEQNKSLEL